MIFAAAAQLPSPLQKVVEEAPVPLLRCDVPKFPVTPPALEDAKFMTGISAETSDLNVGAAAPPEVGPANTKLALSLARDRASVPEVVMGDPEIDKKDGTVIATLVTVPLPPPPGGMAHDPSPRKNVVEDGVPVAPI